MHRSVSVTVLVTTAIVGGSLLTACSSSSSQEASSSPSQVGGMTTCDDATLMDTLKKAHPENTYSNLSLSCADGWAALTIDQTGDGDPTHGINVTYVFEAEGQFWVEKDRAAVCGTIPADAPASRPADAQVPAAIWDRACNTN